MALKQCFPRFAVAEPEELSKEVAKDGFVRKVAFRRDGRLADVMNVIRSSKCVELDAAPGAGKTTRLPVELAASEDVPVVLVMPFPTLAAVTHKYLSESQAKVPVELLTELSDIFPSRGLVVTHAGWVTARWLSLGKAQMPECYLLQDESHESGAASAMIRSLAGSVQGVRCLVTMTATAAASGFREMETEGSVTECEYLADTFKNPWSVEETRAPWAIAKMDGPSLLFEDDDVRAADLMQAYAAGSVPCFRWHARMSVDKLLSDYAMLNSGQLSRCVIIADSTFRSGYTLPVGTIIDSGMVTRIAVASDGKPFSHTRGIYDNERVQSRSRGGRTAGLHSVYWRPKAKPEKKVCDLEQTDAEALAYMYRMLGYKVPVELAHVQLASGLVPRNPWEALTSETPLVCHDLAQRTSLQKLWQDERVSKQSNANAGTEAPQEVSEPDWMQDLYSGLHQLGGFVAAEEKAEAQYLVPEYGRYLFSTHACDSNRKMITFPEGADSVVRSLAVKCPEAVVMGWSGTERRFALALLLNQYNSRLVQLRATTTSLKRARDIAAVKDPAGLRRWAVELTESVSILVSQTKSAYRWICLISKGRYQIEADAVDFSEEVAIIEHELRRQFDGIKSARRLDTDKIKAGVARKVPAMISSVNEHRRGSSSSSISSSGRFSLWVAGVPWQEHENYVKRLRQGSVSSNRSSKSSNHG